MFYLIAMGLVTIRVLTHLINHPKEIKKWRSLLWMLITTIAWLMMLNPRTLPFSVPLFAVGIFIYTTMVGYKAGKLSIKNPGGYKPPGRSNEERERRVDEIIKKITSS